MSTERPHSVSVAGVIVDDQGRALLIKRRDNGHWEPPGGVLEREETIPDALQREVLEETGIKIELPATLTGVYKNMTGLIVSSSSAARRPTALPPRGTRPAPCTGPPAKKSSNSPTRHTRSASLTHSTRHPRRPSAPTTA